MTQLIEAFLEAVHKKKDFVKRVEMNRHVASRLLFLVQIRLRDGINPRNHLLRLL